MRFCVVDHPCMNGLGSSCFAAYPDWCRRALAYRVLHFLLPSVLSDRLGLGLDRAMIGKGAVIPPGVVFRSGMTIPPDFVWEEAWTPWLFLNFEGSIKPWALFADGWGLDDSLPVGVSVVGSVVFPVDWKLGDQVPPGVSFGVGAFIPEGWTPRDPLPPGVVIDHRLVLPVGFDPSVHPPAWLIPGHRPVRSRVDVGPIGPLFVQFGEGGPVHSGSAVYKVPPE